MTDELDFRTILKQRQDRALERRKGERTRDRLKLAAVTVLNKVGYQAMRITDVCKGAGVSQGLFYLYYRDKDEITVEVLTEFLDAIERTYHSGASPQNAYEAIYRLNLVYMSAARANAGLIRCVLQLSDATPAFAKLSHRVTKQYYARIAQNMLYRFPDAHVPIEVAMMAAYTLGGMVDDFCRRLFVHNDSQFKDIVESCARSDEALAEFLSVIWHRALYASDPAELRHVPARALASLAAAQLAGLTRSAARVDASDGHANDATTDGMARLTSASSAPRRKSAAGRKARSSRRDRRSSP